MGWLSKIISPIAKVIDPILPEKVKSVAAKVDKATGGMSLVGGILSGTQNQGSAGGAAVATDVSSVPDTGALTDEEAQAISQKRLARLGKYFTSPLGVLGNASTASQKVFS